MKTISSPLAAVAFGCGLVSSIAGLSEPAASFPPAATERLQRLLEQRREVASNAVRVAEQMVANGRATGREVQVARWRLHSAELELCTTAQQRIALREEMLAMLRRVEQEYPRRAQVGAMMNGDANEARCDRLQAEIGLLREQRAMQPQPPANDPQLRELLSNRLECLRTSRSLWETSWRSGRGGIHECYGAGVQARDAELELAMAPEQRLAAHSNFLAWTKAAGQSVSQRIEAGVLAPMDGAEADYCRYTAEIGWLRALVATTNEAFCLVLRKRCEAAAQAQRASSTKLDIGKCSLEDACEAVTQLRQAELDAATKQEESLAAHGKCLGLLTQLEESQKKRVEVGAASKGSLLEVQVARTSAEIELLRARLGETRGASLRPSLTNGNHSP